MTTTRRYGYGFLTAFIVYVIAVVTTDRGWRSLTTMLGGTTPTERAHHVQVQKVIDDLDRSWEVAGWEMANATNPAVRNLAAERQQGIGLGLLSVRKHLT